MKKIYYILLLLLLAHGAQAQQNALTDLNQGRLKVQTTSMWVLTSWSVANLAYGGIAAARTEGSTKYFNRMNVYWNVVNLGIAAPSLISSLRKKITCLLPSTKALRSCIRSKKRCYSTRASTRPT